MQRMIKIAAVIPAFNEALNIEQVVLRINNIKSDTAVVAPVVINDGSTDDTKTIVEGLDCVGLHLPVNLGIGAAVQTGIKYAYQNDFDYLLQVDGDGQHPAETILEMVSVIQEKKMDVVIGSRYINKEGFQSSFMRRIGINYFKFLNSFLLGQKITDNTSGFRIYNKKAIAILQNNYPDDYPEPETVVIFKKHGLKFCEHPVVMSEREGGKSSISFSNSIYYMIKVTLAIIFSMIRKKPKT